jgi:hypothetical protein
MVTIDRRKERVRTVRALRATDEKKTAGAQSEMENIEDAPLRFAIEVDKEVAAGHQIDPRKSGVAQHVVPREKHFVANVLLHAVLPVVAHEKLPQPLLRDISFDCERVKPLPRVVDRLLVNVGGKNLHARRLVQLLGMFAEQHRDRVSFLSRRAAM